MSEYRPLLMRSNRLLGSALIEHNLVKFEDLEAANERLLEIATTGDLRRSSVLSVLVYEKKVLTEEAMLQHVVDDHGVSVIDLRTYDVPENVRRELDLEACWATWSVPFDHEEDFHFVATAYYLSSAVRSFWEKKLGGQIIWQATTMDIIADFIDRTHLEQLAAKKNNLRPLTTGSQGPMPLPTMSAAPFPMSDTVSPPPPLPLGGQSGSRPPLPA
jgi:Type II secretion system (T2SS), protein E, N-terminal domain